MRPGLFDGDFGGAPVITSTATQSHATLTRHSDEWTQGTWIHFRNLGPADGQVTNRYDVVTNENVRLGEVKWFGRWRCYAFAPLGCTVYEPTCLREIAAFCEVETQRRREAKRT